MKKHATTNAMIMMIPVTASAEIASAKLINPPYSLLSKTFMTIQAIRRHRITIPPPNQIAQIM